MNNLLEACSFEDYVLASQIDKTLEGKFELAVLQGTVMETDTWILGESVYAICDFIAPGAFPGFIGKENAQIACDLYNESEPVGEDTHFVCQSANGTHHYWIID